jgi:hypothetical protein
LIFIMRREADIKDVKSVEKQLKEMGYRLVVHTTGRMLLR